VGIKVKKDGQVWLANGLVYRRALEIGGGADGTWQNREVGLKSAEDTKGCISMGTCQGGGFKLLYQTECRGDRERRIPVEE